MANGITAQEKERIPYECNNHTDHFEPCGQCHIKVLSPQKRFMTLGLTIYALENKQQANNKTTNNHVINQICEKRP